MMRTQSHVLALQKIPSLLFRIYVSHVQVLISGILIKNNARSVATIHIQMAKISDVTAVLRAYNSISRQKSATALKINLF